jgi:hypothetical protein
MARFDKVKVTFRAPLAAAIAAARLGGVEAFSIDANGKAVLGTAAQSGFVGVVCPDKTMAAGDIIDILQQGEIVEFTTGANGVAFAAAVAGTIYTANASGAIQTTIPVAGTDYDRVGHTVEAKRLIVAVQPRIQS